MPEYEKDKTLKSLLEKFQQGRCTPDEIDVINHWFYALSQHESKDFSNSDTNDLAKRINDRLQLELFESEKERKSNLFKSYHWVITAAAIIIFAFFGFPFFKGNLTETTPPETFAILDPQTGDISPGINYAQLSFEDGTTLEKPDSNFTTYSNREEETLLLKVPNAATYSVILEDGTKVWLNSESKISYPAKFRLNERKIKLDGEAYFEVAKDPKRPFIILAKETQIEVLGTSFNVNAYQKEVSTTLYEGSVKVIAGKKMNIIEPGQEAISGQNQIQVKKPNLIKNIAWQKGEFYFDGQNLNEVFKQIQRWYDVEVPAPESTKYSTSFKGSISKKQSLSSVLKILNLATGKSYIIENRTIKAI